MAALSTDAFGPMGDRRFMVVDATIGRFLSQRSHAVMATIATTLDGDTLRLTRSGVSPLVLPFADFATWPTRSVSIGNRTTCPRTTPDQSRPIG